MTLMDDRNQIQRRTEAPDRPAGASGEDSSSSSQEAGVPRSGAQLPPESYPSEPTPPLPPIPNPPITYVATDDRPVTPAFPPEVLDSVDDWTSGDIRDITPPRKPGQRKDRLAPSHWKSGFDAPPDNLPDLGAWCNCLRCGWWWKPWERTIARYHGKGRYCPHCRSPYWDVPREDGRRLKPRPEMSAYRRDIRNRRQIRALRQVIENALDKFGTARVEEEYRSVVAKWMVRCKVALEAPTMGLLTRDLDAAAPRIVPPPPGWREK